MPILFNEKLGPHIMEGIKDCLSVHPVAIEAKYEGLFASLKSYG
jgi:hypothetical protein